MATTSHDRLVADPVSTHVTLHAAAVALFVRDLAATTRFYRDVLGLSVIGQDTTHVGLGVDGVAFLDLLHRPNARPDDPASAGLFHTAFLLPTRSDLGRWLDHARRTGVQVEGAADHLVSEAIYLSDPEGNGIEVYCDRPATEWGWTGPAEARRIDMANKPLDFAAILAAATAPWTGAPSGTRIGHVHLRVGDTQQAAQFYTGVLGLAVTKIWPEAVFLSTGFYHHHIAANVWRSAGAAQRDPARAGLASLTMQAADATIADAIAARSDQPLADLRDPWGTQINITIAQH
ncbi:VOC family protein [Acidisphaera sp. L21]|uniref:VOC family protein n=1 Tax=Acidisphaera sp. L21 TaxID=1641851 RepID=UPI00131E52E4|nr:VOC family protein [Acidisphaera sp. L21]